MPAAILGDVQLGDFALGDVESAVPAPLEDPSRMVTSIQRPARLMVSDASTGSSMVLEVT